METIDIIFIILLLETIDIIFLPEPSNVFEHFMQQGCDNIRRTGKKKSIGCQKRASTRAGTSTQL